MINNKTIGRKLKELRTSRDLKQSELADLNIKSQTLSLVFIA